MKLTKRLLLGSAVMFVCAGAQAADLPVKAKPIEYVKICSLYGVGFYYIPGTDTCIKLSGYLRAQAELGGNSIAIAADNGVAGAHNRLSNYYTARSRLGLYIDTRTATEYGLVRTFFQGINMWTTGSYAGAGTTATNGATAYTTSPGAQVAGGSLVVYDAFIQFAGFTIGRAQSQFTTPWAEYPANWHELPGAASWDRVNQLTYTFDFGQGATASVSAQDQVAEWTSNIWNVSGATAAGIATGTYGVNNIGGSRAPDLVGMVRVDQAWGLFQASFAAHENHAGYYGATEVTGYPSDKWGWAGQVGLSIKNIPTGPGDSINMSAVYANGATRYVFPDFMNATYAIYGGTGLTAAYQSVGFAGLSDSVFVTGSGQELTTAYGFNGGYTHNWDPHWATTLFGGIAAVRHTNTAKSYICGAIVTQLALSSGAGGCNPDFNYATVGTYTAWTPVKGLTFVAELQYTMLDQKFASGSTVTLPQQSGIAKPAGLYELKDQNSLTILFTAQRNW